MPTASQPPDKFAHALLAFRSLYDTYVAPTLPPPIASVLDKLIASAVHAQPYISQLTSMFYSLITTLSGTSGGSAEATALVSTAVMIITLYVSLKVFNYLRRMVIGWIIFAIKIVIMLVGVQVVFYINRYGWENALRDASWWGGIIWGFIEEVLEGDSQGVRAPRGTRSRASARRAAGYGYQGREQVPGGRRAGTRWT